MLCVVEQSRGDNSSAGPTGAVGLIGLRPTQPITITRKGLHTDLLIYVFNNLILLTFHSHLHIILFMYFVFPSFFPIISGIIEKHLNVYLNEIILKYM